MNTSMRLMRVTLAALGLSALISFSDAADLNPPCVTDEVLAVGPTLLGLSVAADGTIYYADYFGNAFGILDSLNSLNVLLTGLKSPLAVEATAGRVYFTEAGTVPGLFHDGTLSAYDTQTGARTVIYEGLHYPNSLFVDATGNVFVLEAGRSSTSFGGNSRLVKFAPGSHEPEVVIPDIDTPAAVVINSEGTILVGSFGDTIPGETGRILAFPPGTTQPVTLAQGLPAIQDMAIDEADNVYVASFDTDGGPMVAVSFLAKGSSFLQPLKSGTHAWCVALDAQKRIYYSTGRSFNSIGRLTPCLPPPLRVSLDSPAHRAAFVFPATIQFEASVQDVDGLVTNVSFFEGTHKLGEAAAEPFRFEWTNAAPGSYALAAIAADDQGRFGTSAPVRIWVQSSNTPPGPAVWVFHDEDPDWTNPPFDDTLAGLDDAGQPVVALGGFNSAQTIGGNRTITTTKEGDAVLVCEIVANRLSKLDVFGQPLFSLPRPITAIDVAADGTIFALEDHTGTIFGENLLRLSADGVLQDQVPAGGFDLAVDDENQAIFVVGADIKYLGYDLRVHWTIDPITWCAVSVDLASDGSAWVAERLHPQVFGSANRLLKVSRQGIVLTTIALPYSPFCVRVDRTDDSIYVAGDRFYKYDAHGNQLFAADVDQSQGSFQPAWSLAIDPAGDIWVGTFRDVRKFTANGNLLFTASDFSYPSDTYVAVPAPSVAAPPIVMAEPQRQMVTVGGTATFSVTATGTRPLHYQWHRNAVPLVDDERISGATTPALSLHKVGAADIGEYSVSIENRLGSVSSAAAGLVVRPPELASERFGNLLMLFWPAVSPNVAFESSPTLTPPHWTPLSQPPLLLQDQNIVPVEMAGPQQFYRLRLVTP